MPELSDQDQPLQLGDTFNPSDYIDSSLKSKVCLVCSLPLAEKRNLEGLLFDSFDKREVAEKHGFAVEDIEQHLKTCILERDASIPVGDLIAKLLNQITSFVSEIDKFRLALNSERNSDSIIAYTGMMREMRMTVDSLAKMTSPTKQAEQIKLQAIKPLVYLLLRSMLEQLGSLRQTVLDNADPADREKLADAFKSTAKMWGEAASDQHIQSLTKLSEILGIDSRELLG